jgi:hypothetical protein
MLFNRGGKVYMSQDLVRYSPDIERADLDFTQHLWRRRRGAAPQISGSIAVEEPYLG